MRFAGEIQGPGLAPLTDDYVLFLGQSPGNICPGKVGQFQQYGVYAFVQLPGLLLQGVYFLAHLAHFAHHVIRGILPLGTKLANSAAGLVAAGAKFIALADGLASLSVQSQQIIKGASLTTGCQGLADGFGVTAYLFYR